MVLGINFRYKYAKIADREILQFNRIIIFDQRRQNKIQGIFAKLSVEF